MLRLCSDVPVVFVEKIVSRSFWREGAANYEDYLPLFKQIHATIVALTSKIWINNSFELIKTLVTRENNKRICCTWQPRGTMEQTVISSFPHLFNV